MERERAVLLSPVGEANDGPAGCKQQLTWLLVADVDVKAQNDDVGEQSRPPVDDEHDHAAEHGSGQGHPHVVVLEAGAPS